MAYSEFPHTNYQDSDMMELIQLYRKVESEYSTTLKSITDLTNRLDEYERDVNSRLDEKCRLAVAPLITQVNSSIENMNSLISSRINNMENYINNEIVSQNKKIKQAIDYIDRILTDSLNEMVRTLNDTMYEHKRETTSELNKTKSEVNETLQRNYNAINTYIDNRFLLLKDELCRKLNDSIDSACVPIVSDIADIYLKLSSITNTIGYNYIWQNVFGIFGFTAIEWFDYIDITCEYWNNSSITCADFYVNGKELLGFTTENRKILSPISGEIKLPEDVLIELINKLKASAINVIDYDKLGITVREYDKMKIKASQNDWRGYYVFGNNK